MPQRSTEEWEANDAFVREERAKRELDQREKAREAQIAALKIPPRLLAIILGGPIAKTEATEALVVAPLIVCLSGNPGNGKTVAAASWLFQRQTGLFVTAAQLARWERYDSTQMAKLLGAPSLVVDDLGTEYQDAKGNFMAIFDELLSHRYDHNLPLVLTTNLDAEAFSVRYGARVVDRLREVGDFKSIAAPSMRGEQR